MGEEQSPFGEIRHRKKRGFLAAYAELGTVTHAAIAAKVDRSSHQLWMKEDEEYVAAFGVAEEMANDAYEHEARRRAVTGIDKPVGFYQGVSLTTIKEYSDTLLIFLMKGAMPHRYKDRHEVDVAGGINLEITDPRELTDGQLTHIAKRGGNGVARKKGGPNGTAGVH